MKLSHWIQLLLVTILVKNDDGSVSIHFSP